MLKLKQHIDMTFRRVERLLLETIWQTLIEKCSGISRHPKISIAYHFIYCVCVCVCHPNAAERRSFQLKQMHKKDVPLLNVNDKDDNLIFTSTWKRNAHIWCILLSKCTQKYIYLVVLRHYLTEFTLCTCIIVYTQTHAYEHVLCMYVQCNSRQGLHFLSNLPNKNR